MEPTHAKGMFDPKKKLLEFAQVLKPKGITAVAFETTSFGKRIVTINYGEQGKAVVDCSGADKTDAETIEKIVKDMARDIC